MALAGTGRVQAEQANAPSSAAESVQMGDGPDGWIKDGKPVTKGWKSLFDGKTLRGWMGEQGYWEVKDGALVGTSPGTPHHHYLLSTQDYSDFEMHIDVKLVGYNSGVCIRIAPETYDSVPGYQVDMGDGFWGCLWEEHKRSKKVLDYPKEEADKILHKDDWNHYYFRAVGHRVTIFLNSVRTGEVDDPEGLLSGPLGFQLCHSGAEVASFKNIYIKTKFTISGPAGTNMEVGKPPTKGTAPLPPEHPVP
jgi:hypothetical protein